MKNFMEHVLTPAAKIVRSVNGVTIDAKGEHDLAPKSDADWEEIASGAATLAEAANALMVPQRALDAQWNACAKKLGEAAAKAYAAEGHDLKTISEIQRPARQHLRRLPPALRNRMGGVRVPKHAGACDLRDDGAIK
jgi:hypothetical protein